MKTLIYFLFSLATAIVGYHIHGSGFWAVFDFLFPVVWLKWIIFHQVTLSIIKAAFASYLV